MPTSFLSLSSELRNKIYELVLLHEQPIGPYLENYEEHTPGLFRTNKLVHREASSLFYAQNRFVVCGRDAEEVVSFLDQIGGINAAYIRHIWVSFPGFVDLKPEIITMEEKAECILAKIQSECPHLHTLTTDLHSTAIVEAKLDRLDNPIIVDEALKLVDTRFRAIPSLQHIIVMLYLDEPDNYVREQMKNRGWTLSKSEFVEESDFDLSWSSDEDYMDNSRRYHDDYDYEDDYDIDNDSDFWRRAGD
ncbi:hypothetical protein BDV95DRAFT_600118 [Massariosphaeria phaeospora]|uniref:Uncharacterized protein n=1 Tax=Massariosphaeria phaeospora TaxID=100035 RepID=A0A7C8M698_9PLEO|nr:hypothetical protein BDV95DRAFT_600118 [Massariosphaeria phaeospora]